MYSNSENDDYTIEEGTNENRNKLKHKYMEPAPTEMCKSCPNYNLMMHEIEATPYQMPQYQMEPSHMFPGMCGLHMHQHMMEDNEEKSHETSEDYDVSDQMYRQRPHMGGRRPHRRRPFIHRRRPFFPTFNIYPYYYPQYYPYDDYDEYGDYGDYGDYDDYDDMYY